MYHPLYQQAVRYRGKAVFLHHVSGRVYHGTIVNVAPHGLYIMQHAPGTMLTTADAKDAKVGVALNHRDELAAGLVYSPVSYFAFGALAGLGLGAMAGAYMW